MQPSLGLEPILPADAYEYGIRSDGGVHGLVLTKPSFVELILDLVGYKPDCDLSRIKLLEPACGTGAFLLPAVDRLMVSARRNGVAPQDLEDAIVAFDIDPSHVEASRQSIQQALENHKVSKKQAAKLASSWVRQGDFLLANIGSDFDVVVGNPPYIRIEQLTPALQSEYRRLFSTLYDRADLYVAFIEKSLHLLSRRGLLGFICADRWTLNKYGAPLRRLVAQSFEVRTYIDLHDASPFESEVIAYPSIFVISRERLGTPTLVARMSSASPETVSATLCSQTKQSPSYQGFALDHYETWFSGGDPWVLSGPEQLAALRALEARFPLLEQDGAATVRIGVATGNDKVYIVPEGTEIEPDRLVPLVMRSDIEGGSIHDARRFVINTFTPTRGVVDLKDFPRLKRYLEQHQAELRQRHIAQKRGEDWFRTIDRVYPDLVAKPKLLIPDIAGANEVVFDEGRFHPHHNLYYITSDTWDLEVLGGLLSSRVALFFVWSYAVKMRGRYLRFQAQYLRRIRTPVPHSLSEKLSEDIRSAFRKRDFKCLDDLAIQAYGLSSLPEFDFVDTRH